MEFSENSETSENQFSEGFNSEFSVLYYTQNRKVGVKTSEICSEVVSSNSEVLWSNSEVFNSDFSVLSVVQNGKLGVENLGKLILRVFRELRVFDLARVDSLSWLHSLLMLKNDTLKNGTSRIGLYGSAPPPRDFTKQPFGYY